MRQDRIIQEVRLLYLRTIELEELLAELLREKAQWSPGPEGPVESPPVPTQDVESST